MKKNVTYLLGAGASANALPVANQIQIYLSGFLNFISHESNELEDKTYFANDTNPKKRTLKSLQMEIIFNLKFLIEKTSITENNFVRNQDHKRRTKEPININSRSITFDDIATNSLMMSVGLEYEKMATTYCLMMSYFEYQSDIDGRYINFINNITNENKVIKPNIKILNWNYDNQLQKAITHVNQNFDFHQAYKNLKTVERHAKSPPQNGCLFRLNGSFNYSCKDSRIIGNPYIMGDLGGQKKKGVDLIRELVNLYDLCVYENYYCLLSLNNDLLKTKSKELAIEQIKDAEFLIIIGSSFPFVNVSTDRDLLNSMPSLKKVFIQDLNPSGVELAFKELYQIHSNIVFETINPDSFYIPRGAL